VICALTGDDEVDAREGNDTVFLGPGNDSAIGDRGDDVIRGGAGGDEADGGGGNDRFFIEGSGRGIDYHGRDVVYGGSGDEYCLNVGDGHGGDVVRGGPWRDRFCADDEDQVYSAEIRRSPADRPGRSAVSTRRSERQPGRRKPNNAW
jgi:Ca2+-binding RTX toxin-like protein